MRGLQERLKALSSARLQGMGRGVEKESLRVAQDGTLATTAHPPALAAVELAPLFARVERLVAADWAARGGVARFEVTPPTLTLMADGGQLEQALLNLLSNAAHATARVAAPSVLVSARLIRGGRLAIEVRDNGPGVPHGLERDIFMPFFSTREHGSGIGLAVVRNLVQGMGGSVRHVKPASGGAAFVMSF